MRTSTAIRRFGSLFLTTSALSFLSLATAQQVLVVDGKDGPGTDFTSLYEAVNSAGEGDTILIRKGTYNEPFLLMTSRSLTVVAEEGARVKVPEIVISGLAADQTVVVRGLESSESGPFLPAFDIRDNEGKVWIEGCDTTPGNGFGGGIEVVRSADVVLVDVHSSVPTANPFGLNSLNIRDSTVSIFDADIEGLPGGAGIVARSSEVFLQGSTVRGGMGVEDDCDPGDGSPGILVRKGASVVLLDTEVSGGAGSIGLAGCPDGDAGDPIEIEEGTVDTLASTATSLELSSPVAQVPDARIEVVFDGRAGDSTWLVVSDQTMARPVLPFGDFVLGEPLGSSFLGVVPSSGQIEHSYALPGSLPLADYYGQAISLGAQGPAISAPSSLTLLP